jgi:hypothetical protein
MNCYSSVKQDEQLTIRLPASLRETLRTIAHHEQRSEAWVARHLIEEALKTRRPDALHETPPAYGKRPGRGDPP